jgi:hypothetical protein
MALGPFCPQRGRGQSHFRSIWPCPPRLSLPSALQAALVPSLTGPAHGSRASALIHCYRIGTSIDLSWVRVGVSTCERHEHSGRCPPGLWPWSLPLPAPEIRGYSSSPMKPLWQSPYSLSEFRKHPVIIPLLHGSPARDMCGQSRATASPSLRSSCPVLHFSNTSSGVPWSKRLRGAPCVPGPFLLFVVRPAYGIHVCVHE